MQPSYQATEYTHYHDHGDDQPPTTEWAVWCYPSCTYVTGFQNETEAREWADDMNYNQ